MKNTGKTLIVLNEVDSTNNYANQLVLSDAAEECTVVLARFQKTGKGQPGNSWESEPNKNLLMSMILFPGFLHGAKQFHLSKITCLTLTNVLLEYVENVTIKWPNDIYVNDKKIAGILIENAVKGTSIYSSVIGIGLNLNQEKFISGAPNPVSLIQLIARHSEPELFAQKIRERFIYWYKKLKCEEYSEIDNSYIKNLYRYNTWQYFKKENEIFEAMITGIGEFGQLQLKKKSGETEEFMFKEVEYII